MDRTLRRSRWRETEFMLREVRQAISPPHPLAATLQGWAEIARQLAEPRRRRRRYPYS